MTELQHFFGKHMEKGKMGRFFGSYNDREFEAIMDELDGHLPRGFVAWHISQEEINQGSKRIEVMKKFPLLTTYSPFTASGETYADAKKALLDAKERENLECK